ncbi:hypothetical protein [Maridesulfovibrio hydrothermalis]|uniref:Glycosaminoglycan attachment site n=1 Tax=Maridesulfovibrio hydrothermalis AM13 = DSM 14728 TaxID=1121451 RepID=L0R712_9BACT|nr:hypothetical protein [Maridesulfovibrio hydrothermalis]CCO22002.1 conserved protein of unknown function [Maridesulfovibrio hydrothermalis AM13 = DSM 14728]
MAKLDVFNPIVSEDKQHPNFKAMVNEINGATREVITGWTDGFVDRDNKIIKEFQTTFNSSFWEFYLNACFRQLGFEIDYSHDRPDFMVSKDGHEFAMEATIASHPDGGTPEWEKRFAGLADSYSKDSLFQIIYLATIRLANAIKSKHTHYVNKYSQLEHVKGKPYIICLAPFEQPLFFAQADAAIRKVLYKYSAPLYVKDEATGDIRIVGEEYTDNVVKSTGANIPLGLFLDDGMKEISAVIFSNTATMTKAKALNSLKHPNTFFQAIRYNPNSWDKPYYHCGQGGEYRETLLDGLHIFLNPYAEHPFDPDVLYSDEISLHDFDMQENSPLEFINEGALFAHQCITLVPTDKVGNLDSLKADVEFKDYSFKWEEGTLYQISANVGLGIDNHLAHYKGWTLAVFKDSIDNDWGAFAKGKEVSTMQEFLSLSDTYKMLPSSDFYSNKEEAFADIKKVVDLELIK